MTFSIREARCADQDNPGQNPQFKRQWAEGGTTGAASASLQVWHAADVVPPMSRARRQAEAAWATIVQRPAP